MPPDDALAQSLRRQLDERSGIIAGVPRPPSPAKSLGERLRFFAGPNLSEGVENVGTMLGAGLEFLSPAGDVKDLVESSRGVSQSAQRGDPLGAFSNAAMMAAALLGMAIPGPPPSKIGKGARELSDALRSSADDIPAGLRDIRPHEGSMRNILDSNFNSGRILGDETVPIDTLTGGVSRSDQGRVKELAEKIAGPEGFFSRIAVDRGGDVVEGQHRLDALRLLGVNDVPVTRVGELTEGLPVDKMRKAIGAAGGRNTDQQKQIIDQVAEMLAEVGDAKAVRETFEFPRGFEKQFEAALDAATNAKAKP